MEIDHLTSEFLGLPTTNDPRLLLGITKGRNDAIAINNALRRRLAQLHVHPSASSIEAQKIRIHLHSLRDDLLMNATDSIGTSKRTAQILTPLDKAIIASLVSEGGWNSKSRSRLVGVASAYSITVGGLTRILEAFAVAARNGRGPLSSTERSLYPINRTWTSLPAKPSAMSKLDVIFTDAVNKLTPELNTSNPVMTIKLSVLFGLMTLIAFILSLQVLLSPSEETSVSSTNTQNTFPKQSHQNTANERMLFFQEFPTFSVLVTKNTIHSFADQGVDQIAQLISLGTSVQQSLRKGIKPDVEILKEWNNIIHILSQGWMFIDSHTLQLAQSHIIHVLIQSSMDKEYAKKLLQVLDPPKLSMNSPQDIYRSVWAAGILASIGCDIRLDADIRLLAKQMQLNHITTCDSVEAGSQSLQSIADELIQRTEFDTRSFHIWEAWLLLANHQQALQGNSDLFLYVIHEILDSNIDLLRESNTRKVLGRLVNEYNWSTSISARDSICALISSETSKRNDLAVLTALFHESNSMTWFNDSYLISLASTFKERKEIALRLLHDWPLETSEETAVWNSAIPAGFNHNLYQEWKSVADELLHGSIPNLILFAKLRIINESAFSIWKGRPDLATHSIEQSILFEIDVSNQFPPIRIERDDSFTAAFRHAGNNTNEKLIVIDSLLNDDITDLGVHDAELLATISLSSSKSKLRIAATNVINEQFANGRHVAIALLSLFPKATTKEQLTSLIAHLTNVVLPDKQSPQWDLIARRALVQHALAVGNTELWTLDEISSVLSSSLLSEYNLLHPNALPLSSEIMPNVAIDMVLRTWIMSLPSTFGISSTHDFNATGILQSYLQKQLQYYSLLFMEEAMWKSSNSSSFSFVPILERLHQERTILDQLVFVESLITKQWLALLSQVDTELQRTELQK